MNQCKDPYETTSIIFFFVAQMTNSIDKTTPLSRHRTLSVLIAPTAGATSAARIVKATWQWSSPRRARSWS